METCTGVALADALADCASLVDPLLLSFYQLNQLVYGYGELGYNVTVSSSDLKFIDPASAGYDVTSTGCVTDAAFLECTSGSTACLGALVDSCGAKRASGAVKIATSTQSMTIKVASATTGGGGGDSTKTTGGSGGTKGKGRRSRRL